VFLGDVIIEQQIQSAHDVSGLDCMLSNIKEKENLNPIEFDQVSLSSVSDSTNP
jgi:hypothetical protein